MKSACMTPVMEVTFSLINNVPLFEESQLRDTLNPTRREGGEERNRGSWLITLLYGLIYYLNSFI